MEWISIIKSTPQWHEVSRCSCCGFTTDKFPASEMRFCMKCGERADEQIKTEDEKNDG